VRSEGSPPPEVLRLAAVGPLSTQVGASSSSPNALPNVAGKSKASSTARAERTRAFRALALQPAYRTSPNHRDRRKPGAMALLAVEPKPCVIPELRAFGAMAPKPINRMSPNHRNRGKPGAMALLAVEPEPCVIPELRVFGAMAPKPINRTSPNCRSRGKPGAMALLAVKPKPCEAAGSRALGALALRGAVEGSRASWRNL